MKSGQNAIHIKYLIASEQDISWGLTINTVGFQHIGENAPYPPQNHPLRYLFSTEKGRILEEYQLLYIVQGKGFFSSKEQKCVDIHEGQMFLLFPGEWHSYHPDKKTGWDEYWIGFNGLNMDKRVAGGFFKKQKPIYNVRIQDDIVQMYKHAIVVAKEQKTGYQQMLAGIVNLLLGYAYAYDRQSSFENLQVINQINKAKIIMAENLNTGITPEEVAARVQMSYSGFRRIFKQYTRFAPIQYMQELKINKSKELLTNTTMMVKEIAFEVGFNKTEYFYPTFKKRTGYTPDKYREFTQGKNL